VLAQRLRESGAPPERVARADPRELALRALRALRAVVARSAAGGDGRELARDLLAADALVTYAFEAQAARDVDGLRALADFVAREGDGGSGETV